MKNKNKKGLSRIIDATGYSVKGLIYAWKNERAFREELVLAIFLVPLALFLGDNNVERVLMIGSCFMVLIAEVINSAIEATVDRISTEQHPLAGSAKDLGSAAVFLSLVLFVIVWFLMLI